MERERERERHRNKNKWPSQCKDDEMFCHQAPCRNRDERRPIPFDARRQNPREHLDCRACGGKRRKIISAHRENDKRDSSSLLPSSTCKQLSNRTHRSRPHTRQTSHLAPAMTAVTRINSALAWFSTPSSGKYTKVNTQNANGKAGRKAHKRKKKEDGPKRRLRSYIESGYRSEKIRLKQFEQNKQCSKGNREQ